MDRELFRSALLKYFCGLLLLGLLLFLPAGTFAYWQGWLLIGILFVPMFVAGLVMMAKAPALLRKRLSAKEEQTEQKKVVAWSALMFLAAFVLAGLNVRFGWMVLPHWVSWAAAVVFLLAYLLYAEVLRENAYLSRTIEVQEHQKVVDTGLYGIVRHPMYAATVLLFLAMPLVLGSPFSFAVMLFYLPIIARRIRNEEAVLEQGLEGYREYRQRVRFRLIPGIW
ncbi:MAG: isoprenylcysteine carboxylmethyltransferase family protein [Oscillospiraceae bacterium]|nr:isoprenylcysteine carboxylmethyltransferase family protein [Oscillospiraceae bacterium]